MAVRRPEPRKAPPDEDPFAAFGSESDGIASSPTPVVEAGRQTSTPRSPRHRRNRLGALVIIAVAAGGIGFILWQRPVPGDAVPGDAVPGSAAPAPPAVSVPSSTMPARPPSGSSVPAPSSAARSETSTDTALMPRSADAGGSASNTAVDDRPSAPPSPQPQPASAEPRVELQPLLPPADAAPTPPLTVPSPSVERTVPSPALASAPPGAIAPARATDSDAIEAVLRNYEHAYDSLDADAAAVVWPSVDVPALTRAFALLRQQNLEFSSCSFVVATNVATARCEGSVLYSRRIGDARPRREDHSWTMELVRAGERWQIAQVIAR